MVLFFLRRLLFSLESCVIDFLFVIVVLSLKGVFCEEWKDELDEEECFGREMINRSIIASKPCRIRYIYAEMMIDGQDLNFGDAFAK